MARFGREDAGNPAAEVATVGPDITRQLSWPEPDGTAPVISENVLAALLEAVEHIPASGAGGLDGILETLLAAKSVDDLNRPWNGTSGRELAGRRLRLTDVIRRPSQFEDGPQLFLVVTAADAKTGERVTMTTSALAVILQVAVAWNLGMFPLLVDVTVAEKPTARGYYPYHLTVLAAGNQAAGNG